MIDLDVLPQALLFALVIIGLYFTVRSVMKPTIREGATGSRKSTSSGNDKSITTQITDMSDMYDSLLKNIAGTDNLKIAALKDAKDAVGKAGTYIALTAFAKDAPKHVFDQAPKLVALRQVINQALQDAQGGSGGGQDQTGNSNGSSSNDNSDGDNGGGGGGSWL